jgi:hypothetical protein
LAYERKTKGADRYFEEQSPLKGPQIGMDLKDATLVRILGPL